MIAAFYEYVREKSSISVAQLQPKIDGTQLYGKYRRKLLISTSIDSNKHLIPLAFAIVDERAYRFMRMIFTSKKIMMGINFISESLIMKFKT